jgi:DNA-binding transcriptional MerR regulator
MDREQVGTPRHPIRVVSRRTGLSPARLRAWEKRFGVVAPYRTEGRQRLYTDDDVHRLGLLKRVVEEGRSIRQVVALSVEELQQLEQEDQTGRRGLLAPELPNAASVVGILEKARTAVEEMDDVRLERILTQGAIAVPFSVLTDEILVPLFPGIGSSWSRGQLGPAQEHLAAVAIRRFLEWLHRVIEVEGGAPVLAVGTPTPERQELGALLAVVSAAAEGWKAVYLGPDLPASEIAFAATRLNVEAVALSLVSPALTVDFLREITALREALPLSVRLVVGGSTEILEEMAVGVKDTEFFATINEFREGLRKDGLRH